MNVAARITEERKRLLLDRLADVGFSEPFDGWLAVRLQAIAFDIERCLWLRDRRGIDEAVRSWGGAPEAVRLTRGLLDQFRDRLTAEQLPADFDGGFGSWDYDRPDPISPEEFERIMLPPDVSEDDIETTRRVLKKIEIESRRIQRAHDFSWANRIERNAEPEKRAAIIGLVRIWCQAQGLGPEEFSISSSPGSPAMNFVEPGVQVMLGETMTRPAIEKQVIAWRKKTPRFDA